MGKLFTGSEILLESLRREKVEVVFGLPGGAVLPLYDALYSAGGAVLRSSAKGNAGKHVGDELDFTTNFHLSFHQDILVGYSVLFPGEFIRKTGASSEAQLLYVQYSFKW